MPRRIFILLTALILTFTVASVAAQGNSGNCRGNNPNCSTNSNGNGNANGNANGNSNGKANNNSNSNSNANNNGNANTNNNTSNGNNGNDNGGGIPAGAGCTGLENAFSNTEPGNSNYDTLLDQLHRHGCVVDSDGDGVPDDIDRCLGGDDNIDSDGDGIPDACEYLVDSDGDGVIDDLDQCPGFDDNIDTDGDGIPDGCDDPIIIDSDGDGVEDSIDQCPGFDDNIDTDADGIPDGCDDLIDSDGDGVADSVDQCPGFDDNIDTDADGIPDGCDDLIDSDGDGSADDVDCEPNDPAIHPNAEEIPNNGIDENCDGSDGLYGRGDISFTLSWDGVEDYDLFVAEPSGEVIYHGNRVSATNGQLDADALANCVGIPGDSVENIFWPQDAAPDGVYTVSINMLSICGSPNLSEWTLTIRVEGELVETYTGTGNSDSFTIELPLVG